MQCIYFCQTEIGESNEMRRWILNEFLLETNWYIFLMQITN